VDAVVLKNLSRARGLRQNAPYHSELVQYCASGIKLNANKDLRAVTF